MRGTTDRHQRLTPLPGGMRANSAAFLVAAPIGLVSFLVALVLIGPYLDGTTAFVAGRLTGGAVIGTVLVAVAAYLIPTRLSGWVYVITVPLAVAVATVLPNLDEIMDGKAEPQSSRVASASPTAAGSDAADPGAEASAAPELPELTAPAGGGPWIEVDDAQVRAEVDRIIAASADDPTGTVVAGAYVHRPTSTAFLYVGVNGPVLSGAAPDVGLDALMDQAAVTDYATFPPGEPGGALGCGVAQDKVTSQTCVWASERRAVLLRFDDPSLPTERAADLTKRFRDFASS